MGIVPQRKEKKKYLRFGAFICTMFRPCLLILWLCIWFSFPGVAQRDVRIYLPGTLTGGIGLARTDRDPGSFWIQEPGAAIMLNAGIGVRYLDKFGAHVTAGLVLNSYSFARPNVEYSIASYTTMAQATVYGWFPLSHRHHSHIHIGVAGARIGYGEDLLESEEEGFRVSAKSFGPSKYAIIPEIGAVKTFYRSHLAILLTYPYHLNRSDVLEFRIIDPQGGLTARSRAEFIGMHVRFAWDIYGYKDPPVPVLPAPPDNQEILARTETRNQRFTVRSRLATLYIADNGQEDQDSISVLLNGQYIVTNYELKREPGKFKLRLQPGMNTVTVVAHNTGQIPPNTSSCELRAGLRRYKFGISTDLQRNEVLMIEVK